MAQCRTRARPARHPARCPASGNETACPPRLYGGPRVGQGSCSLRDQDRLLVNRHFPDGQPIRPRWPARIVQESVGECEVVHTWKKFICPTFLGFRDRRAPSSSSSFVGAHGKKLRPRRVPWAAEAMGCPACGDGTHCAAFIMAHLCCRCGARSRAISDRISWNICRDTATASDVWAVLPTGRPVSAKARAFTIAMERHLSKEAGQQTSVPLPLQLDRGPASAHRGRCPFGALHLILEDRLLPVQRFGRYQRAKHRQDRTIRSQSLHT